MMNSYSHVANVTPSDTVALNPPCFAFTVTASGTVTFSTFGAKYPPGAAYNDGLKVQIYANVGVIYPIRCSKIWATGTAATGIVALW